MSCLEARGISFGYGNGPLVLSGVSLSVASDERIALCAPSGRGKSTLCQILAGYLQPGRGSVLLDGVKPQAKVGCPNPVQMIWQHPELALDPYLRLGDSLVEAGPVSDELVRSLGIQAEWLDRYPHELSGGELQRCCIARTLSLSPQFIIADEISTMLDAVTQAKIWKFLLSYCQEHQVGLVMVTHSDALMEQLSTRVVTLH